MRELWPPMEWVFVERQFFPVGLVRAACSWVWMMWIEWICGGQNITWLSLNSDLRCNRNTGPFCASLAVCLEREHFYPVYISTFTFLQPDAYCVPGLIRRSPGLWVTKRQRPPNNTVSIFSPHTELRGPRQAYTPHAWTHTCLHTSKHKHTHTHLKYTAKLLLCSNAVLFSNPTCSSDWPGIKINSERLRKGFYSRQLSLSHGHNPLHALVVFSG